MIRHSFIRALLLAAFVGFFFLVGVAQNYGTVSFVYDANGNRISRTISFRNDTRNGTDLDSSFLSSLTERFCGMEVSLYPNPTPDRFTLSIIEDDVPEVHVFLFTIEGVLLDERTVRDSSVEFDLSGRSAGLYLMKLIVKGESKAWQVLKR
ncbi:MAG: T9SS type A sorting domain-containing protein [Bacteroidales bacterium]|nr:T9SS type A sorting domain-containing protein [Bacteroidales bacterium]